MAFRLTASSRIGVLGDSISAIFGTSIPWVTRFAPQVRAQFAPVGLPAVGVRSIPTWYVNGSPGRAVGDISGTIATVLTQFPKGLTHLLFQLGINDAAAINAATLTIPTLQTQVSACIAGVQAMSPVPQLMWCGPWGHGNPADLLLEIGQVKAAISALVQAVGGTYVDWSVVDHSVPANSIDGTHPNNAGGLLLASAAFAQFSN